MSKGLGRGLGALIPSAQIPPRKSSDTSNNQGTGALELSIEKIRTNPDQPRKHFDHHALEDLTASIKEHGILQPLVVTPADRSGNHLLIAGERRFRASEMLGLKKVPVVIREADEHEQLTLALVENIQRADLNPMEEAIAYRKLMDEFNLTQEETAKRLGKSRSGIANFLRLLDLPEEVQSAVADGKISAGHAKILASLGDAQKQADYAKQVLDKKMSVRELSQATKKVRKAIQPRAQRFDPVQEAQEEMLRERLGTKVQIKKTGAKGQIMIHFYSLEELQRLLNELT